MGTIGGKQTFEDPTSGKTTWVENDQVSPDGRWLGSKSIVRDPITGKVTKVGEDVAKRDAYGKLTHLGENKVDGSVNLD